MVIAKQWMGRKSAFVATRFMRFPTKTLKYLNVKILKCHITALQTTQVFILFVRIVWCYRLLGSSTGNNMEVMLSKDPNTKEIDMWHIHSWVAGVGESLVRNFVLFSLLTQSAAFELTFYHLAMRMALSS